MKFKVRCKEDISEVFEVYDCCKRRKYKKGALTQGSDQRSSKAYCQNYIFIIAISFIKIKR